MCGCVYVCVCGCVVRTDGARSYKHTEQSTKGSNCVCELLGREVQRG